MPRLIGPQADQPFLNGPGLLEHFQLLVGLGSHALNRAGIAVVGRQGLQINDIVRLLLD
jgi:hypothetical protein